MQVSRQQVVDYLRRLGRPQAADEALRDLPDVVDEKEAREWAYRQAVGTS